MLPILVFGQPKTQKECDDLIGKGIEKMYHKEHSVSLEFLIQAKSAAESNNWIQQNFRATNNIGANYYMMLDFGEALKYYLEAYEIAEKSEDTKNIMTVLNNIAILYFQERNHQKAHEYFFKAYQLANEKSQPDKKGFYALNLGFVLNKLNRLDEAERFITEAAKLIPPDSDFFIMIEMAKSENNLFKNNLQLAERQALSVLPALKGKPQLENRVFIYLVLAQVYGKMEDYEKAISFLQKARKESANVQGKVEIYQLLSGVYAANKEYGNSLSYKDSVIITKDSLNNIRNSALYENGKIKFEIQNYQYELKESERKLESSRNLLLTILISGFCIILLIGLAFRNSHIKHKQKEKIAELELEQERNENLLLEKQLKEQEALALLESEKLKNELEKKNRKLATRALHLSSKNEFMEEMIQKLSSHPQTANNDFVKNYIRELKIQLKNEGQLDSFFTHFEEANPGFLNRLKQKHPDLIPGEIRFITYVYMNLNNKEIASLLNITPQSTRKRKERLGKKLNLPEGQTLFNYLSGI
ncbi:MAG TPA: tetratricopeptide repeat protein [Moheibacter sp.]|nr:tetratricopeptide repeat protein [Moheibacter sp.]